MKLIIGYLYSDLMNIYGDTGNIIALQKRAQWRDIEVEIRHISIKDKLKKGEVDLFFFGGGQDQAQELIAQDLQTTGKGEIIKSEIERGVPMLSICGGYQLLGEYYKPHKGPKLPGINVFKAFTEASFDRMIGNVVVKYFNGELVGFENHSGKTYLKKGAHPLGKIISGFGNNGEDKTEGCTYKNAVGCYLHGSLLPKNPKLTDWFIKRALKVKYGKDIELKHLDDSLEEQAHQAILTKLG